MTNPKPKFCVGEEVRVTGCINPENNCDKTEIIRVEWFDRWSNADYGPSYGYITCNIADRLPDHSHPECNLRKLPPESRTGWEDCVWKPVSNKETAK